MKTILDASSLLNLTHGEVLDMALGLPAMQAVFGAVVYDECPSIKAELDLRLKDGRLSMLDEDAITASAFTALLVKHGLGDGETECLAYAEKGEDAVCCDDGKARTVLRKELGVPRVIGSIGLLLCAIKLALLTPAEAMTAYEKMRAKGAFLPDLTLVDFEAALPRGAAEEV